MQRGRRIAWEGPAGSENAASDWKPLEIASEGFRWEAASMQRGRT